MSRRPPTGTVTVRIRPAVLAGELTHEPRLYLGRDAPENIFDLQDPTMTYLRSRIDQACHHTTIPGTAWDRIIRDASIPEDVDIRNVLRVDLEMHGRTVSAHQALAEWAQTVPLYPAPDSPGQTAVYGCF